MQLPESFRLTISTLYGEPGVAWLRELPQLIAELEQRWGLQVLPRVPNLSYNYVAPAIQRDGTPAILKLSGPGSSEVATEIYALTRYDGRGICRLLQADQSHGALLLERLLPGTTLTTVEDDEEATRIAATVMQQLWRPLPEEHPLPSVADWAKGMQRLRAAFGGGTGPFPAQMVATAERLFSELLTSSGPPMLLHGDLHHDNILRAQRAPWLAIDPKGVAGEPAYEVGALLRNPGERVQQAANPRRMMERRIAILADALGIDQQRIVAWCYAQVVLSVWWGYEDHQEYYPEWLYYAELVEPLL